MMVALPPGHPATARAKVKLAQLDAEDWLCGLTTSSCRDQVIQLCRDAGFEPRVSFESDDYVVLQGLVAAGLGVALLPELALTSRNPGIEIRPIAPKAPVRRVWSVTRECGGSRSPAIEAMLGVLREVGERFAAEGAAKAA